MRCNFVNLHFIVRYGKSQYVTRKKQAKRSKKTYKQVFSRYCIVKNLDNRLIGVYFVKISVIFYLGQNVFRSPVGYLTTFFLVHFLKNLCFAFLCVVFGIDFL